MGPGGRKVVALGITIAILGVGASLIAGGTEEIGEFFDDLAEPAEEDSGETVTLEDTTIESGELPEPAEPEEPIAPAEPEPAPGTDGDVEDQFEEARRQLDCIAEAPDAEAMARCVQTPPGP